MYYYSKKLVNKYLIDEIEKMVIDICERNYEDFFNSLFPLCNDQGFKLYLDLKLDCIFHKLETLSKNYIEMYYRGLKVTYLGAKVNDFDQIVKDLLCEFYDNSSLRINEIIEEVIAEQKEIKRTQLNEKFNQ